MTRGQWLRYGGVVVIAVVLTIAATAAISGASTPASAMTTCTVNDDNTATGGTSVDMTFTGPQAEHLCPAIAQDGGATFAVVDALPAGDAEICGFDYDHWTVEVSGDATMQLMGAGACAKIKPDAVAALQQIEADQQGDF